MGNIRYLLISRKNPVTKEYAYTASKISAFAPTITTQAFYAAMAENAHIPVAQIPSVFTAITKAIENFCLNGHSVSFPDFGTFRATLNSGGQEVEEDFKTDDIKGLRIRFLPSAKLNYELRANTTFTRQ